MIARVSNIDCHIINVFGFIITGWIVIISLEDKLLVMRLQLDIAIDGALCCLDVIVAIIFLEHVLLYSLREPHNICASWLHKVSQVRDEVTFTCLLLNKNIRVNFPVLA